MSKRGGHTLRALVRYDPYRLPASALYCVDCQKTFRNADDALGAKCRPRKDRGYAVWRSPDYWPDRRARHKRGQR